FSTIEFGLRGQPGSFYEEGGAKEARGLVKEGGKVRRRGEKERPFLVPPEPGGACVWGVPRRKKGMKGRFALEALYPPHNEGSVVLGSVEACFFSRVFLVINTTCP
ncbi:hypothetical protein Csa_023852, partial [Cucumis sativus]